VVTEHDTKEIDSCMSCPLRVDMRQRVPLASQPEMDAFFGRQEQAVPSNDLCSHWGSPPGNRLTSVRPPPEWCPVRKKPLLLRVVR
jgi:hypothetical protein